MINKLLKYGIKEKTIEEIKNIDFYKYNLEINLDNCIEIINYLRSININKIDELMLYVPDMFISTKEEVEERFNRNNINRIVNLINEDYTNIDELA